MEIGLLHFLEREFERGVGWRADERIPTELPGIGKVSARLDARLDENLGSK